MAFWDINKTLSYNGVCNVVVGNRGGGKTFGWKKYAAEQYFKHGYQWVYVRRYEDELRTKSTFWDDIRANTNLLDGYETKIIGWKCYIRKGDSNKDGIEDTKKDTKLDGWDEFGYFFALADAQKYKSTSLPLVHTICFDEFIIENASRRYIGGEFDLFVGLIDTIDRDDNRCKVFLLSNAGALNNPYFLEWNIKPTDILEAKKKVLKRKGGAVVCEWWAGRGKDKTESIVSRIGSEKYVEYANNNIFKDSGTDGVEPVEGYSVIFNITDGQQIVGVSRKNHIDYFTPHSKAQNVNTFVIPDGILVQGAIKIPPSIKRLLRSGMIERYSSLEIKHATSNILQSIIY